MKTVHVHLIIGTTLVTLCLNGNLSSNELPENLYTSKANNNDQELFFSHISTYNVSVNSSPEHPTGDHRRFAQIYPLEGKDLHNPNCLGGKLLLNDVYTQNNLP